MFKTFGKVCVVSLLVVAMAAPIALATTARQNSLARSGDYINDDSNIFRWYATLPSYSNMVMAELGTYNGFSAIDQALGITHSCGENGKYGTWGIFLMDNVTDNSFFIVNPVFASIEMLDIYDQFVGRAFPVNKFAIQWGKEFEKLAVGLGFTRSDADIQTADLTSDLRFTTFGGGIRADAGESAYMDVAFTVGVAGGENIPYGSFITPDTSDFDKQLVFDGALRIFYEWKDYATLVPFAEFQFLEFALENPDLTFGSHGDKINAFRIGAALNLDVNTNNLLVFGVEVQRMSWEPSVPDTLGAALAEFTAFYLPTFRLALESAVKPWLTVRVGAIKSLVKGTDTYVDASEIDYTDAFFDWFLGAGFHIAEFDIDMELGPELPFSVGYWLTGHSAYDYNYGIREPAQPADDVPISRISAIYHF
ncbi:MAG: hypothetical protein GTO42_01930 [Candidatus Latescibacteria bacterium]|nr:hypothetical protein [Candidatus Latescibacterota bacterium]NIO27290.1 hypothetical protein [Candidatus Latescibacterota bacterium]NIO54814.1 hypothetical protein [Candidatus Latescibacterota bacterium]NIT00897.1 hypothetical protein [Candidatus Latescibacterota bacterium]NIT37820.1 hypothetical protein [Candidatus Latescibacterota bacterium]